MAKKKGSKNYFDLPEEEAVVEYLSSDDPEFRDKIFREKLNAPLNKMVESLIKRYRLMRDDVDIDDLKHETLSHLLTKFDKFKPDKNKKAYSYYGTISVNYLKGELLKYSKRKNMNISYEDISSSIEEDENFAYELDLEEKLEVYDFIPILVDKMEEEIKVNDKLKPNDIKVGYAIIELLTNWEKFIDPEDSTNILNRNKILYFIRESTFLDAKDVRNSLKKFKILYHLVKDDVYGEEED